MTLRVEGKFNVLGTDLTESQIDGVLNTGDASYDNKRAWLVNFFQLHDSSELVRAVLIGYVEADAVMARISFGAIQEDIYVRLVGTLASAKRCYAYGEYLACIELCALHGEMLSNYLCITDKEKLESVFSNLPDENQKSINANKRTGIYFADMINQTLRLRWLYKAGIISSDDRKQFLYVHGLRIKYFHHWSPKRGNERLDAIKALTRLSPVTAKYLEILGEMPRTYNTSNLERVKKYMRIVSGESSGCNVLPQKLMPVCEFFSKIWNSILSFILIK